jgi:hypothetical protein
LFSQGAAIRSHAGITGNKDEHFASVTEAVVAHRQPGKRVVGKVVDEGKPKRQAAKRIQAQIPFPFGHATVKDVGVAVIGHEPAVSFVRPFPPQYLHGAGWIRRPGRVDFVAAGKPVPLHAEHLLRLAVLAVSSIGPPGGIARVTRYRLRSFEDTANLPINAALTT